MLVNFHGNSILSEQQYYEVGVAGDLNSSEMMLG
jgi:hypothetical protein